MASQSSFLSGYYVSSLNLAWVMDLPLLEGLINRVPYLLLVFGPILTSITLSHIRTLRE